MLESRLDSLMEQLARIAILSGGSVGFAFKNLETAQTLFINEHIVFPSASLIKIHLIAGTAVLVERGILSMSDRVLVEPDTPEVVKQREQDGSGILARLHIAHELTIEELCTLAVIISDNVAANLLLNVVGMDLINQVLAELDFTTTRVTARLEDFDGLESPLKNPTTPYETLSLLEMLYHKRIPFSQEIIAILKQQQFNSRLPFFLPSDLEIAHKTGSLTRSFHDAGIIYTPFGNYALCILTKDITSKARGELVIAEMSRVLYESFVTRD